MLGVKVAAAWPSALKPAMRCADSIHIQILPGGRSKEAMDGGMGREEYRERSAGGGFNTVRAESSQR